jgi:ubiquinone/menaquinone biosynthesis C-methylase UbiE
MDAYARKHAGSNAVARYQAKFANRIDRIRHDIEQVFLARHVRGRVFDCTIGIGRFIGGLPEATSYEGLDLSPEFVEHVRSKFPGTRCYEGNLVGGIPEPDNAYDCVICLRSLSAIGHLDAILAGMIRITAPGGLVIVDYGRKAAALVLNGESVVVDGANAQDAIARLAADPVEVLCCDALLTRIKKSSRLFRLVTGPLGRIIPDSVLRLVERCATPLFWERQIVVLRKRKSPDA